MSDENDGLPWRVWFDGNTWVIARTVAEAIEAVTKNVGEWEGDVGEWTILDDVSVLTIHMEDEDPPRQSRTCAEWIKWFEYAPAVIGSLDW